MDVDNLKEGEGEGKKGEGLPVKPLGIVAISFVRREECHIPYRIATLRPAHPSGYMVLRFFMAASPNPVRAPPDGL